LQAFVLDATFLNSMLYRKSTLGILLVLIFLSFFGTLTLTASMFPQNYDWRYRVISNLLSPRDNPDWYWIAAVGLGLSGVLMLPFAGYLGHSLGRVAPRMAKVTAAAFVLGIITLTCACVVFPQHTHATLGIQRLHEFLGHSSAGFFAFGMLCGCWCASKVRTQNSAAAWLFWSWLLLTAGPLIGLFCSETLLLLTKLEPSWAEPIRHTLRHSVFWHLGYWEWTGATGIFLFLCAAVFFTPAQAQGTASSRTEV
jgi:hypothetical protein